MPMLALLNLWDRAATFAPNDVDGLFAWGSVALLVGLIVWGHRAQQPAAVRQPQAGSPPGGSIPVEP